MKFGGRVHQYRDEHNILKTDWLNTGNVMAMAYDMPVSGYANNTVNNLRLWAVKSTREFDLGFFNMGNYIRAVDDKQRSETISRSFIPMMIFMRERSCVLNRSISLYRQLYRILFADIKDL